MGLSGQDTCQLVLATTDQSTQHMLSCQRDNTKRYNQNTRRVLAQQSRLTKAITVVGRQDCVSTDEAQTEHVDVAVPLWPGHSKLNASYRHLHGEELDPLSCGQTS